MLFSVFFPLYMITMTDVNIKPYLKLWTALKLHFRQF